MAKHKIFRCAILISAILMLLGIFLFLRRQERILLQENETQLINFYLDSMDGHIAATWTNTSNVPIKEIEFTISGSDGYIEQRTITPDETMKFDNGTHGVLYEVSMCFLYQDNSKSDIFVDSAMFLQYDKLPNLPIIRIETANHEDPTADDFVSAEDGNWGAKMMTKEYVNGSLNYLGGETNIQEASVQVRVRGNTSSTLEKKPYKIKLGTAVDFIADGENHPAKEWILLAGGNNLNTYIGSYIGTLCGMEWQPRMQFVNCIINNDWKGCYILIEQVEKSEHRLDVEEQGYIFENDAYWWASDGIYFKTANQNPALGFTFTYPEIKTVESNHVTELKNHMQIVEDAILENTPNLSKLIDLKSFAGWIMARDIGGQGDAGGSNMYYYIKDLTGDEEDRKVRMGPVWDFDGLNMSSEYWSLQHTEVFTYFPMLFENETFRNEYAQLWNSIYTSLMPSICLYLDELKDDVGEDLQKSWELDAVRWKNDVPNVEQSITNMKNSLEKQIGWINKQIVQ